MLSQNRTNLFVENAQMLNVYCLKPLAWLLFSFDVSMQHITVLGGTEIKMNV